ncbi:hypothetical protein D3C84_1238220 [compost metagenome]
MGGVLAEVLTAEDHRMNLAQHHVCKGVLRHEFFRVLHVEPPSYRLADMDLALFAGPPLGFPDESDLPFFTWIPGCWAG